MPININESVINKDLCANCFKMKKEYVIIPCFHECLCQECFMLSPKQCPICNSTVIEINKIDF